MNSFVSAEVEANRLGRVDLNAIERARFMVEAVSTTLRSSLAIATGLFQMEATCGNLRSPGSVLKPCRRLELMFIPRIGVADGEMARSSGSAKEGVDLVVN